MNDVKNVYDLIIMEVLPAGLRGVSCANQDINQDIILGRNRDGARLAIANRRRSNRPKVWTK